MAEAKAQPIGALIPGVLKQVGERYSALHAIQQRWGRLVGRRLAAHTRPVSLRRGRLVVAVDGPGDGFLLSYQRPQLLERLQGDAKGAVEDIIIRPGRPKEKPSRVECSKRNA